MTNPLTLLRTRLSLLIGLCLVFVALSDNVLYGQTLGINLPLAGAALLLLLAVRVFRRVRPLPQVAAVLAIVGLLAAQAYRTSLPAALLTGVGLITLALGVRHGWTADVETWAQRWMRFLPAACLQPFRDQAFASRWRSRHPRFVQISRMMVMRFCLPLALGALFIGLFALANPVLANWLSQGFTACWDFVCRLITLPPLSRLLLWLAALLTAWALCRARGHQRSARRRATPPPLPPQLFPPPLPANRAVPVPAPEPLLTSRLLVQCLILFNVLFAVQNLLDSRYLWGGAVLPQGLTWAQYAHRGAYPLIVTALLAAVFILWAFHPGCRAGVAAMPRRLLVLWVAQNVFLTLSAVWRLNLYVRIYSLTLWRVAAVIWMFLVMAGLLWILWRILRNRGNAWLINANVYTLVTVLYLCCWVDWAGLIAAYNIRHCRETGGGGQELDVAYLQSLGTGTLPALTTLLRQTGMQESAALRLKVERATVALQTCLRTETRDWRGWTLQRQRTLESLRPSAAAEAARENGVRK
jgi:hypothetical protein